MHISQTYNRDRDCKITICYAAKKKKTVNLSLYCVWKKEKNSELEHNSKARLYVHCLFSCVPQITEHP